MKNRSALEEIKNRIELLDVIGEVVQLRKSGRAFKGLCPFHTEKTPSFFVFPESRTWHCFGCGEGGDLFAFAMHRDNLSFGEAAQNLAQRAGVALATREPPEVDRGAEERLFAVNQAAALYYHAILRGSSVGAPARQYLNSRGLTPETLEVFGLGYAPEGVGATGPDPSGSRARDRSPLRQHLLELGYTLEEMTQAGLLVGLPAQAGGETGDSRDRFRGRVLFPIRDDKARVLGFGGRGLTQDAQPKYLNSSQSPIFDKGACLYAVDQARDSIRREGTVVVVEGYVDAIMAHQFGFRNVVATMGTSITDRQLSLLRRLAPTICFALDPDAAGDQAVARTMGLARETLADQVVPVPTWRGLIRYQSKSSAAIKVVELPPGQDPDEVVRRSPEEWRRRVAEAVPVFDFLLRRLPTRFDLSSASGKSEAVEGLLLGLHDMTDPVQRNHYAQALAQVVGVDDRAILDKLRWSGGQRMNPRVKDSGEPQPAQRKSSDRLEEYSLALLVAHPSLASHPEVPGENDFSKAEARALMSELKRRDREKLDENWLEKDSAGLGSGAPDFLASVRALAADCASMSVSQAEQEMVNSALELRKRGLATRHRQLKELLADSESEESERDRWQHDLRDVLSRLTDLQRRQAALGGRVPPMVWRYKRAGEVLSGR